MIQMGVLILVLAAGSISHAQEGTELAPANPNLVPQDFTVDDGPVSISY
jgi:hypothetical protein